MIPPILLLSVAAQTGGGGRDLTFLAYLDVWIISGLVLLAVVVVLGKLIWNRLRRRDDHDEWYDTYYDEEYVLDDDPADRRD